MAEITLFFKVIRKYPELQTKNFINKYILGIYMKQEEILIRTPQVFGNGAHISVPKYWLGSEITLIKPKQRSVKEKIISLIEPYFDSILGVYLYGSHARGEQREDSDIDLLIISDKNLKLKADGFEIY